MSYMRTSMIKTYDLIGTGTFGEVYKVPKDNGFVAVKVLKSPEHQQKDKAKLLKEVELLKKWNKPDANIVKFLDLHDEGENVHIYMEYMAKGSIHDIIKQTKKPIEENMAKKYTKDICNGLQYLHENKVLHRDIKGQNILIDHNNNAALGDFGLSIEVISTMTAQRSKVGTLYYISPEILQSDKSGRRSDIWSLGCTVVEMLTMFPPWKQFKPADAMKMIINEPNKVRLSQEVSPGAQTFLSLIFVGKDRRCYIDALIKHPWINTQ